MPEVNLSNIDVYYETRHNGGGIRWAPEFLELFRTHPKLRHKQFNRALELCSGPGFIGFNLLGGGIVKRLALSDINPAVEPNIIKTVSKNSLDHQVEKFYLSDGLANVDGTFDLIVSNPPHIDVMDPDVPALNFQDPPILYSDANFKLHKHLFKSAQEKLTKDGIIVLLENGRYSPPEKILGGDFEKNFPNLTVDLSLPCTHSDFYFIKLKVQKKNEL